MSERVIGGRIWHAWYEEGLWLATCDLPDLNAKLSVCGDSLSEIDEQALDAMDALTLESES